MTADLFQGWGTQLFWGTMVTLKVAFLSLLAIVTFAVLTNDRDRRRRVLAAVTLVAALSGLYLTYTRAAWLAAALGCAVVAATLGRRALLSLVAAAVLLVVLVPGISERFAASL